MAKQRLVMLAATVVTAAIVAAVVIVAVGDTSETESPAAPTVVAAVVPVSTATPDVTQPPATRTPSVPQSTPRAPATPAGTPRPSATPLATPTKPLDLATAPALKAADKTVTVQPGQSPFAAPDGKTVVLYDTQAGTSLELGPATGQSLNNPFGQDKFAFVDASGEAWLVDLPGSNRTSLGKSTSPNFVDPYRVRLGGNSPDAVLYDTRTAVRTPISSLPAAERQALGQGQPINTPQLVLPTGMTMRDGPISVADDPCRSASGNAQRLCWDARPEDVVLQDAGGRILYSFRALKVGPAGPGELLIATPPVCADGTRTTPCIDFVARLPNGDLAFDNPDLATGTTNLYILDLASGSLRFIATARYNLRAQINNENYPLEADANYVAWTDSFCGPNRGKTRIFDRKAGTLTELDGTYWFTLRAGKLGLGELGVRTVIDPSSGRVLASLPEVQGFTWWSADYRYAAVSAPAGRGGLCP
jgi:hypothetical protein